MYNCLQQMVDIDPKLGFRDRDDVNETQGY